MNCQITFMNEIMESIYLRGKKSQMGVDDYNHYKNGMELSIEVKRIVDNIDCTRIAMDDLVKISIVRKQIGLYYNYKKDHSLSTVSDYLRFVQTMNKSYQNHVLQTNVMKVLEKTNEFNNRGYKHIRNSTIKAFDKIVLYNNSSFSNVKLFIDNEFNALYESIGSIRYKILIIIEKVKIKKGQQKGNSLVKLLKSLKYGLIQKKYNAKLKRIRSNNKDQIKVAFLVIFDTVFPYKKIFELMLDDPFFDPYIIVVPTVSRSFKYQIDTMCKTYESFHLSYKERVILGFD